jgi:hypothetical protein
MRTTVGADALSVGICGLSALFKYEAITYTQWP